MAETMPQWKGLFDWSMQYQDGTKPTDFKSETCNPEKLKWLEGVLKNYMVDFAERMADMQSTLAESAVAAATQEQIEEAQLLLEELTDIVESIDFARDLRSIGGLPVLKSLLQCPHPSLQCRAAEVVAVCAQNNAPVQEWFQSEGVLPLLAALLTSADTMTRLKALLAVSSMVRGDHAALKEFAVELKALPAVVNMLLEDNSRVVRKALEFCKYVCQAAPACRLALVLSSGCMDRLSVYLQGEDEFVMASALGLLAELADDQGALQQVVGNEHMMHAIKALKARLEATTGQDRAALEEEVELIRGIWASCAPSE